MNVTFLFLQISIQNNSSHKNMLKIRVRGKIMLYWYIICYLSYMWSLQTSPKLEYMLDPWLVSLFSIISYAVLQLIGLVR